MANSNKETPPSLNEKEEILGLRIQQQQAALLDVSVLLQELGFPADLSQIEEKAQQKKLDLIIKGYQEARDQLDGLLFQRVRVIEMEFRAQKLEDELKLQEGFRKVLRMVNDEREKKRRKEAQFTPAVLETLTEWYNQHKDHPYPTPTEKQTLCLLTQLEQQQLDNWFANRRTRQKKKRANQSKEPILLSS